MTTTQPTQEQVDRIAEELAPDVVRIRVTAGEDWSGDPAIYFRIVLSDEASKTGRLSATSRAVRDRIAKAFELSYADRIPYFRFRSHSEQSDLREASWE